MLAAPALEGQRIGVYGLARTGRSAIAFLRRSGAHVVAWDAKAEARGGLEGIELIDLDSAPLEGLDAIVVSPGVPLNTHPLAARAAAAGVPLIGDIELFARTRPALPPHRVVGITGTNGKSTTTALIHHLLGVAGVPARMGGNIGLPILDQPPLPEDGVYVLELSSFQIDLTRSLDCDVAVLTNVTPDHLDRYAGFDAYAAAKERLFEMQSPASIAVIATDDEPTRRTAARAWAKRRPPENLILVSAASVRAADQAGWPSLQGPHNAQNVACAISAVRALGLDDAAIERGLATYPGLPHRMERVGERDGVLFVNDSKATNPTSTAPALAAYPAIRWIAGGLAKTDELDACAPHLGHVRKAYLVGEAAPLFARLLAGKVPTVDARTVAQATLLAAADAAEGEVVLLSPACASYDQFSDYEARGAAFRAAVEAVVAGSGGASA